MRWLIKHRRELRYDESGPKMRAITFAFVFVGCATVAHAQQPHSRSDLIVLHGGFKPETVSISLQESCFGTTFRFEIVNRPNGSFLTEARRGGRRSRDPESLVAVKKFLKDVRNVRFRGTKCFSANEMMISLYGVLAAPPVGKSSQVSQSFTIRF